MSSAPLSSLSIFMPAFNEEENIQQVVRDALRAAEKFAKDYEIIVINDGSKDQTAAKVKELMEKNSHIRLINHPENKGYGAAVKSGLKASNKEWIFFTDSDGQFKFDELGKFVSARDKADFIIGYRKKRMDPFHRVFVAQVLLKTWNIVFFGLRVKDVDCAYKLFRKSLIRSIKLETESAITVTELLLKARKLGYKFHQLPVTHYPRRHGVQTGGNYRVILRAIGESIKLFFDLRRHK